MNKVSVLIIDKSIEHKGIIANNSFVLGLTAGREMDKNCFGAEVLDADNSKHFYLTNKAHFVRKAGQGKLKNIRLEFIDNPDVLVIDYTKDASTSNYEEYTTSIAKKKSDEIIYQAVYLFGPEELIVPKTKNLSSLS